MSAPLLRNKRTSNAPNPRFPILWYTTWCSLSPQHLRQEPPLAFHRLAHPEPPLHLPAARRHRMHHRNAEILLQEVDDRQHAPAGAEEIDRVSLAMLEESLLDVGVDLLGRKLANLVEVDLDAFHAEHIEASLDKIFREQ